MMAGTSLGESTVDVSFNPTWLVLSVGTPHHVLKAKFWVS